MTVPEMLRDFRFKADRLDSAALPDLTDAQVLELLNEGQDKWVSQRYTGTTTGASFEVNQIRVDDLRTLVYSHTYTSSSPVFGEHTFSLDGPQDYMHMLRFTVTWDDSDCGKRSSTPKFVQHDDLSFALVNPFQRPDRDKQRTVACIREQGIVVYAEWELTGAEIIYLKKPVDIALPSTPSELPDWVHRQIVDEAVQLALERLESPRQRTHTFNLNAE